MEVSKFITSGRKKNIAWDDGATFGKGLFKELRCCSKLV
jgi:hypothetical protein